MNQVFFLRFQRERRGKGEFDIKIKADNGSGLNTLLALKMGKGPPVIYEGKGGQRMEQRE